MTYTDLTPICQITPAVSSGDINAQANSILKVLSGEDATFDIPTGGITLPLYGYMRSNLAPITATLGTTAFTFWYTCDGLSITSQPSAADSTWCLDPNVTYTYIETNIIPIAIIVSYCKSITEQNIHPAIVLNTTTWQFELRIVTVQGDNTITYSAWSNNSWCVHRQASTLIINQLLNPAFEDDQQVILTPTNYTSTSGTAGVYVPKIRNNVIYEISQNVFYVGNIGMTISSGVIKLTPSVASTTYTSML